MPLARLLVSSLSCKYSSHTSCIFIFRDGEAVADRLFHSPSEFFHLTTKSGWDMRN
jgi:hypothetical protein